MEPVRFDRVNVILRGPEGSDIKDLPVYSDETRGCISCWKLSGEELMNVLQTKTIWLAVTSEKHPPVMLSGFEIILSDDEDDDDLEDDDNDI